MKISSVVLCDFAQVREGLTFISSGNITRIGREVYPANLGANLSLTFFTDLNQQEIDVQVEARLYQLPRSDEAEPEAGIGFNFNAGVGDAEVPTAIQLVLPAGQLIVPRPGLYELEVQVGDQISSVDFVAEQASLANPADVQGPPAS